MLLLIGRTLGKSTLRDGMVKCQINQIATLIKLSILNATNRVSERSTVGEHRGIAA